MKLLVTGTGSSGSWRIRGEQLGRAIGATVAVQSSDAAGFDAVVVVKRTPPGLLSRARAGGARLIWDVVDAWRQPEGNDWQREQCMRWLAEQIAVVKPHAIVAATKAMAADLAALCDRPVLSLEHHARPDLEHNPIREHVRVLGYEGGLQYIGRWRQVIEAECRRRGWSLALNPASLADVDIVLALRDAKGYAPRNWKSNVKLANAQGSGTPFIGCREAGYLENTVGNCEKWADTPEELSRALDELTPQAERCRVSRWMLSVAPRLEQVAARYREWLAAL